MRHASALLIAQCLICIYLFFIVLIHIIMNSSEKESTNTIYARKPRFIKIWSFENFRSSLALVLILSFSLLLLSGCDDDPVIPNEEELITHVLLRMVPDGPGDTLLFVWIDEDGEGGNPPLIGGDTLSASTVYACELLLRNNTVNPAVDISEEVMEEADEHLVFYELSAAALGQITYEDEDSNGKPLGLKTSWQTFQPGTGTLTVVLRHQPDKNVVPLTPANAGGSTDAEVTFQVVIQ
jgi:hypothetical protein